MCIIYMYAHARVLRILLKHYTLIPTFSQRKDTQRLK
jgi:hypothetical protein